MNNGLVWANVNCPMHPFFCLFVCVVYCSVIFMVLDLQGAKKVDPKGGKKAAPTKSKKEGSGGGKAKKKV